MMINLINEEDLMILVRANKYEKEQKKSGHSKEEK